MYIYRQKLDIRELTDLPVRAKKVMLLEPESYACALYAYHLSAADYFVRPCRAVDAIHEELGRFLPDLLVVNPAVKSNIAATALLLKEIRGRHPGLRIITVTLAADGRDISRLMAAGVNAHLDRRSTRPEDIVTIVRSILNH